MDLTEQIREDITMSRNKKISENKTGDDSTETEKFRENYKLKKI